jgi:hypothetical protein
MKKTMACILALVMVLGLAGCGKASNPSVDELKNAMDQEEIELESFDVSESDDGFTFEGQGEYAIITGTADKDKNVTKVTFENSGTNSAIFESNDMFEQWYSENVDNPNVDYSQMTIEELRAYIVALNCIDELQAFYSLFETDDAHTLAVNTLLQKSSSEIKNWSVSVSVVEGESDMEDTIIIEAVCNK